MRKLLLYADYSPTVNIGSEKVVERVPIFKQWQSRDFKSEEHLRKLEKGNE